MQRSAWICVVLLGLITACILIQSPARADEDSAGPFAIPPCAWKRTLGDIPSKTVSSSPNRGVALGGFGAGSFMYNISGSFGPWELKPCDVRFEQFWKALPQAAFHYYEKSTNDAQPRVKCLSTDGDLKPAWDKIRKGEATYYAL